MYDTSHTQLSRLLGTGNEIAHSCRDTIIESGAHVDDEVCFLDHEIRCRVTVHAHEVQGQIVSFVETSQSVQSCTDRNLEFFGKFFQLCGAAVASLSGNDDGFLCPSDKFQHVSGDLVVEMQISFLGDGLWFPRESIGGPKNSIRDMVIRVETVNGAGNGFQIEIVLVVDLEGQALVLVSESDRLERLTVFSMSCVNASHADSVVGLSVGNFSNVGVDHFGRKNLVLQVFWKIHKYRTGST